VVRWVATYGGLAGWRAFGGGGGLQWFGCERVHRALHTSALRYAGAGPLLHRSATPDPCTCALLLLAFEFVGWAGLGTREHEQRPEPKFGWTVRAVRGMRTWTWGT